MTDAQIAALMGWPLEYMADVTDPLSMVARVRALVAAAEAAERERCAKLCESARDSIWGYHVAEVKDAARNVCTNLAAAIRGN